MDRMGLETKSVASIIQIVGGIAIAIGVGLIALPAGIIAAGIMAITFGVALGLER
jgi:uncharacterized membrane-anchored protein YitT (DUF2179 family)